MKSFVYPAVLQYDKSEDIFVITFQDLDIITSGETIEEAYLRATDYLKSYIDSAIKFECEVQSPSKYEETEKLNPKSKILLSHTTVKNDKVNMTDKEKEIRDFVRKLYE